MQKHHRLLTDKNAKVRGTFVEHVSRREVYLAYGGRCGICKGKLRPNRWELDHIIPASRGGEHSFDNVQPSHPDCNRLKADLMPWEFEALLRPPVHRRKKGKAKYRHKRPRKRKNVLDPR